MSRCRRSLLPWLPSVLRECPRQTRDRQHIRVRVQRAQPIRRAPTLEPHASTKPPNPASFFNRSLCSPSPAIRSRTSRPRSPAGRQRRSIPRTLSPLPVSPTDTISKRRWVVSKRPRRENLAIDAQPHHPQFLPMPRLGKSHQLAAPVFADRAHEIERLHLARQMKARGIDELIGSMNHGSGPHWREPPRNQPDRGGEVHVHAIELFAPNLFYEHRGLGEIQQVANPTQGSAYASVLRYAAGRDTNAPGSLALLHRTGRLNIKRRALFFLLFRRQLLELAIRRAHRRNANLESQLAQPAHVAQDKTYGCEPDPGSPDTRRARVREARPSSKAARRAALHPQACGSHPARDA